MKNQLNCFTKQGLYQTINHNGDVLLAIKGLVGFSKKRPEIETLTPIIEGR
ncbi:hypothetical protein [Vibrio anguillarum]|uniref:hypothetical protein n=1 Tax=Vibrio anguillarum TaxID=55601 RepID=UPI0013DFB608|nr:hypothetical protein [Vibrio anguillarum]